MNIEKTLIQFISKDEFAYLIHLSDLLYTETIEAIKNNKDNVIVFIDRELSPCAKVLLAYNEIDICLVPQKSLQGGIHCELWKSAIVMQ
jgi:hypothetical protein